MDNIEEIEQKLISAREVSKILSIAIRTVWRLRSSGKLPKPIKIGGALRWRLSDINLWIELECPSMKQFEYRKTSNK